MDKDFRMSILLDTYGNILTNKQRLVMRCYYDEDLSLSEISENCNITRQGVLDFVRTAEKKLLSLEKDLGFVAKLEKLSANITEICERAKSFHDTHACEIVNLCENILADLPTTKGE